MAGRARARFGGTSAPLASSSCTEHFGQVFNWGRHAPAVGSPSDNKPRVHRAGCKEA